VAVSFPRVVLDTNVVISALWGGLPRDVVLAWLNGRYALLISAPILAEYHEVLNRLHPGSPVAARFLHAVYLKGIAIDPKMRVHTIHQDPDDNRFLECAVAGKARYLVSGDRHLLRLRGFREVRIVTPRAFLTALGAST